tara:strand:+ start:2583 stop:3371 length:789 start_codon:yes stop_codon:yes gene_type:complete
VCSKLWLELKNIDVIKGEKYLLKNINLKLYENEIITILGPNGAGKSSLLGLINRTLYPVVKKGSKLEIFGQDLINIFDLRKSISIVNEDMNKRINNKILTRELILSGIYGTIGVNRNQVISNYDNEIANKIINDFGLEKIIQNKYTELSDGQKRNVLIARAIVNKPKVLILDEPTINLDMKSLFNLFETLSQLISSKITVLFITNNIDSIIKETDRVILLKEGKILADGAPEIIMTSEKINQLYETDIELLNIKGNWRVIPK